MRPSFAKRTFVYSGAVIACLGLLLARVAQVASRTPQHFESQMFEGYPDENAHHYHKVVDEVSAFGASRREHPFAGRYDEPSGLTPRTVWVAPSGRFCVTNFFDGGGVTAGWCSRLESRGGLLRPTDRLGRRERLDSNAPPYRIIAWGERRYLVPEKRILDFVNAVNAGSEPRWKGGGEIGIFMQGGFSEYSEDLPRPRLPPDLPAPLAALLRPRPVHVRAKTLGPTERRPTFGDHAPEFQTCLTSASLDAGSAAGVFVGMKLYSRSTPSMHTLTVRTTAEHSAQGAFEDFTCDDPPPPPSARLSSRVPWHEFDDFDAPPLRVEVKPLSSRVHAPFLLGKADSMFFRPDPDEARREGFTVEPVADALIVGSYYGALGEAALYFRDRLALSMGANAFYDREYVEREANSREADARGVAEVVRLALYRISFKGRPIDPAAEFAVKALNQGRDGPYRHDWKDARARVRPAVCGEGPFAHAAADKDVLAALRWKEPDLRKAPLLRFSDLSPEQRAAVLPWLRSPSEGALVWNELMPSYEMRRVRSEAERTAREEYRTRSSAGREPDPAGSCPAP